MNSSVKHHDAFHTAYCYAKVRPCTSATFAALSARRVLHQRSQIVSDSYTLIGQATGNLRQTDPTLNCVTTRTLTNLMVNKSTYVITGGTATAQVTVTNGSGSTKTVSGNLTFNGDGTVTVVINGRSHTF